MNSMAFVRGGQDRRALRREPSPFRRGLTIGALGAEIAEKGTSVGDTVTKSALSANPNR